MLDVKEVLKDSIPIEQVVGRLGGLGLSGVRGILQGDCITGHTSEGHKCFSINTRENYYHCFHCGIGGDIISLVMEVRNVEFKDALKWLAQEFRPDLLKQIDGYKGELSPQLREYYQKADLYSLIFEYGKELLYKPEGKTALDYLTQVRGYKVENIKQTEWMYIPPDTDIKRYLINARPTSSTEINSLPTFKSSMGFICGFPYRDRRGAIVGFVLRNLNKEGERWNSIGGTLKHDLFNLCNCKGENELIIVEGYPDAMYLPTLGVKNIVAVGQGLLSKTHIEGLQSFKVRNVIIAFDNDPPKVNEDTGRREIKGEENTIKALTLLRGTGIDTYVIDPISYTPYKDPDEMIRANGIESFQKLIEWAKKNNSGPQWIVEEITGNYNMNSEHGKREAIYDCLDYDEGITNPLDSKVLIDTLSQITGTPLGLLTPIFKDYHDKKAEEKLKRGYETFFREGERLLHEGKINDLREYLEGGIKDLRSKGVTRVIAPYTYHDFIRDIKETPPGLKTGYKALDRVIRIPQEAITIIAGRPSHGKTTLLLNLFLNMVMNYPKKVFCFFSYEENKKQLWLKLLNILSGEVINENQNLINLENYIRGGNTNNAKIEEGKLKLDSLMSSYRALLIDEPYFINDLSDTLAYLKDKHDIGAVFIDYIQKIKAKGSSPTRQVELQRISAQLLENAKTLSIPIALGAQLGRDPLKKDKVRLDNLRESGDIEQDANLVLGLYNEAMEKAQDESISEVQYRKVDLKVTVLKNRYGPVNDEVTLTFDRPTLTIREREHQGDYIPGLDEFLKKLHDEKGDEIEDDMGE